MEERTPHQLWIALEAAVRTPADPLPVDAWLPDPREEAERLVRERESRRRPASPAEVPGGTPPEDSFEAILEETSILEPGPPSEPPQDLDAELRSRLSGNSFADLEDV